MGLVEAKNHAELEELGSAMLKTQDQNTPRLGIGGQWKREEEAMSWDVWSERTGTFFHPCSDHELGCGGWAAQN